MSRLVARSRWLDHLLRAARRYTERHGNHYAAAVTFFSVLSLVPLLMIVSAIAGYVLYFNPALLADVRNAVTAALPEGLADTVNTIVAEAVAQRHLVAGFGLLVALYSGIGWMSNLRAALSEQWAQPPEPPPLLTRLLVDLLALLGLTTALLGSFVVTTSASLFAADVLAFLGVGDGPWARARLQISTALFGLTAHFLVFLWVIARLPRRHVPLRGVAKAALLGSIGFAILTQGMTIYLRVVATSPSTAVFGSAFGLLIFIYFASRFALFVTAWAATGQESVPEEPVPVPGPALIRSEVVVRRLDAGTAAALIAAGIITGLFGRRLVTRRDG